MDIRTAVPNRHRRSLWHKIILNWQLYLFLLPAFAYVVLFQIAPLYGLQIAFRDYRIAFGISGSKWVGLKHFNNFFNSFYFTRLFVNTFALNFLGLFFYSIVPVLLAITLNSIINERAKRIIQTIIYIPHFISSVVLAGVIYIFFSPENGIVNKFIVLFGGKSIHFMLKAECFRPLYIGSTLWQNAGWDSILYIAALTSIDVSLYEAATIDGATRLQKVRYIELPAVVPIFTMMLILSCGRLLGSDTEKILLLQTAGNSEVSDVFGTYIYKFGIEKSQFSYTTAIGLVLNSISFVMILIVNSITKRMNGTQLF